MYIKKEFNSIYFTEDEFNNLKEEHIDTIMFAHNDGQGDTSIIKWDSFLERWKESLEEGYYTQKQYLKKIKELNNSSNIHKIYEVAMELLNTNRNMTAPIMVWEGKIYEIKIRWNN